LTEIDQTRALQDFFRNKFTNEALFAWIAGRLSTTYFQSYVLALEVARMAQRAYQFEYRTETSFIAATYWDDLRKGLTAGQTLSQSLSMMETSYVRSNVRLQEITKTVSLRQQNPVAFLELVRTGETHFELPESLFDEDFPGHYRRLIKTITKYPRDLDSDPRTASFCHPIPTPLSFSWEKTLKCRKVTSSTI
jgi:hypothetical protein